MRNSLHCVIGLIVVLGFASCNKKSGEAMVLAKEHIAAREPTPTPSAESSAIPTEPVASFTEATPGSDESTSGEEVITELHEDEINVNGYVMMKNVRGTGKDPRATDQERWIVSVKMVADLRLVDVQTNQARWEKLKVGDRIKIIYQQGKYTGTIWNSEIE